MLKYFLAVSTICYSTAYSQIPDSYTINQEHTLTLEGSTVMIKFMPGVPAEARSQVLDPAYFQPYDTKRNKPQFNYAFVQLLAEQNAETLNKIVGNLFANKAVAYAAPVYRQHTGELCAPTNKIFVKLKPTALLNDMLQFLDANYLDVVKNITEEHISAGLFKLEFNIKNTIEIFTIADALSASGLFIYCEPNLVILTKHTSDDTYYDYQWSLKNTGSAIQYSGTPGSDVDAECAWGFTKGAGVKIAVLDEGVDLTHDDLTPNLVTGYDAVYWGGGVVDNSEGGPQAGSDDAHGTNCAGIIAAVADNGIGVTGVAPESNVIPVRIAYSDDWGWWVLEYDWVIDAIEWSIDNGDADILSNSYQLGSYSAAIADAIEYVITEGRDGKGGYFIAAAGNGNSATLVFPGNNINSIGVGAMSMCEERKSFVSCDGENYWGSNYGSALDVSAPGVKIPSTDISGNKGYSNSDYYLEMNGTSSATPLVAGVVALLISYNPDLTYEQGRYILESTCEKSGTYTYDESPAHPNGTWVNQLGYGMVNACNALNLASAADIVSGIDNISADITAPGTSINIDYFVQNNGFTDAGLFSNQFLLAEYCDTEEGIALYENTTASLMSTEEIDYTNTITIPENTAEGNYNIVLFADKDLLIPELLESNNITCAEIFVQCIFNPLTETAFYGLELVTDSLFITSTSGCEWTITPAPPEWITIENGTAIGNGYFVYTLAENTDGIARSFTFHYGGSEFTITQDWQTGLLTLGESILVYPNPANDFVIVDGIHEEIEYTITNMLGQEILSGTIDNQQNEISLYACTSGVYVLRFVKNKAMYSMQLIKN